MPTMRDVAAVAGVSPKTVSRVFNDDPHVLPETRARVEAALRELDYVPNTIAQSFRTGRSTAVGIAVPSLADPFFAAIVAAVDEEARRHDLSTVVTSLGRDGAAEAELVESLLRRQLTGLILVPVAADQRYLSPWRDRLPIVFVDRPPSGITADSFTEDDLAGSHLATTHLIEHGHRRIAFIGDNLAIPTTAARLAGYRQALLDHGIPFDETLVGAGAGERGSAETIVNGILERGRATALFATNARSAIAQMPAIKASGLATIVFGDFAMADMLSPSITVIDQDPTALGTLAAQRLVERLQHPDRRLRRKTVLPVRLVERESCRIPALARDAS